MKMSGRRGEEITVWKRTRGGGRDSEMALLEVTVSAMKHRMYLKNKDKGNTFVHLIYERTSE